MKIKTKVKSGALHANNNQPSSMKLKTKLKADALSSNHNQQPAPLGSVPSVAALRPLQL